MMDQTRELYSMEAEHGVLGAIMLSALEQNAATVDQILESAAVADFYFEDNAALLQAIIDCHADSIPVDPVTLGNLRRALPSGELTLVYASEIASKVPSASNWREYLRYVRERAVLRRLVEAGDMVKALASQARPLQEIIALAQQSLADLRNLDDVAPPYQSIAEVIGKVITVLDDKLNDRAPKWASTGLPDLDELMRGVRPKKITVIAGLPGSGKTTLALQIAQHNAFVERQPWLVFSLEMPEEELGMRALASLGGISLRKLDDPKKMTADDWASAVGVADLSRQAPLYICDSPEVTTSMMRSISRRVKREHGLAGIVVDYLQLVPPEAKGRTRSEEVGAINKALLRLCKELDVPLIELAQLNRDSTKRPGKKPQSSDLRDSGEIEADASCILMVHRDMDTEEGQNGLTELLMTKCRHAKVGSCIVQQEGQHGRFVSLGRMPEPSMDEVEAGRPFAAKYSGARG